MRVVPMLSRIDQGEFGRVCVVVPASQMKYSATCSLHLSDYGEVIVVGSDRAVMKMQEVLKALDFEVELEEEIQPGIWTVGHSRVEGGDVIAGDTSE